ncbi:MAG: hypothetical protein AABY66_03785, partial [Nitrospirota bacterium]
EGKKAFDNKLIHEFSTKLLTQEKDAKAQGRIDKFQAGLALQRAFHASWLAVQYNLNKTSWKLVMENITRIREDLSGQLKAENGKVLSGEELGLLIKDAQMLWEKAEGAGREGVGTGIPAFDKIRADLDQVVKKKLEETVAELKRKTAEAIEKSKAELKNELKRLSDGEGTEKPTSSLAIEQGQEAGGREQGIASSEQQATSKAPGGIDLNPGNMDLRTNYGADRIQLPMPDIPLENIKIDGLVPFIIRVAPITNLPLLLGLADEPEADDAAGFQPQHSPIDAPRRFKARDIEEVGLLN